ncbi:type I restriction enzyme S subunit [Lachnospiraceae bacterium PF1-22]|uniref:restriction endonuclease subunit S n=1 Tax=Ohessyouella blattaphilus TaxID=2949333 RepID=UPI003E1F1070
MDIKKAKEPAIRFKGFTGNWEQRKLGELVEQVIREVPKPEGSYYRMSVRSHAKGTFRQFVDDPQKVAMDKLFVVRENDLVVNITFAWEHAIAVVPPENDGLLVSHRFPTYRADGISDIDFLRYLVAREDFRRKLEYISPGGAGRNRILNKKEFLNLKVIVPETTSEQKIIGRILNKIDNLITLHQRELDLMKQQKRSLLSKMFPKNGTEFPELRFIGFANPWEQRKLSEIATMHARIGWQNLRTSEFLDNGKYMLITGTDFKEGAINFDTCHYVERERYEQDKHIQIKNGSILITKDGTLGKVAYVQGLSMPATLNAGVFNVETKDEMKVDKKYLFQYLKAPYLMDYVEKKATGGTIKHLNQNILVEFPVVMPSKQEQKLIGTYFQQLDTLITLHQRKLETLKSIKKSFLAKMFV